MAYWLVKSEPGTYAWDQMVKDRRTHWDGVRNHQASNNLKAMGKGDLVFFYHSVSDKAVIGLARVDRENYPDPTAKDGARRRASPAHHMPRTCRPPRGRDSSSPTR